MRSDRAVLTPGGALLLGALAFLLRGEEALALLAAVCAHEAGHLLAMYALGVRLEGVTIAATGPVLRCAAPEDGWTVAVIALAGPACGAAFWFALRARWTLAAEMSAVLTLVNLLPVLPLDGGRALRAMLYIFTRARTAEEVLRAVRWLVLLLCAAAGALAVVNGWGPAPLLFSLWLAVTPKGERGFASLL